MFLIGPCLRGQDKEREEEEEEEEEEEVTDYGWVAW